MSIASPPVAVFVEFVGAFEAEACAPPRILFFGGIANTSISGGVTVINKGTTQVYANIVQLAKTSHRWWESRLAFPELMFVKTEKESQISGVLNITMKLYYQRTKTLTKLSKRGPHELILTYAI